MFRFLKSFACLALGLLSFQSSHAFSLLGPVNEAYQVPEIGYNLTGDIGAPKNLHEEYRWNTPFTFYAFDASFLEYFGSNGVREIEKAIAILNDLTNYPYSTLNPDDWPLESRRVNTRAQALNLFDLKSAALTTMVEELGLAEPDRWVWTLRDRRTQPGLSCPWMIYDVIRRNFDPITHQPSTYINGVLFSYVISEICTGPNPLAVTVNFPVDPTAQDFTAVASTGIRYGDFYTGLTRDDVGGFRFLMRTNNVNWESPSDDSIFYATNTSQPQFLVTSNLSILQAAARTNDAATLTTLFPGLNIIATSNTFRFAWVTNVTPYLTNYPWDAPDATTGAFIPHIAFATNRTWTVETIYVHTFGNLIIFRNTPDGLPDPIQLYRLPPADDLVPVTVQTIVVTNFAWSPAGNIPITNYYFQTYYTNRAVGEYFIMPTNVCDVKLLSRLGPILTTYYTNLILSPTNTNATIIITNNLPGVTNGLGQIEQYLVESSRTRIFSYFPVECVTSNSMLRLGMDRIHFIRTDFDSLIGRYYKPITNYYHLLAVTNSVIITNWFQRVAVTPDWLFQAADFLEGAVARSVPDYRTNNAIPGLAGPGTMDPTVFITFNKVGPLNINIYGGTNVVLNDLHELGSFTNFIWGSFDGRTNEPIVYPQDVRVDDIERLIYFQVTTAELPDATVGTPYAFQLEVFGGRLPHKWAPAPTSAPLPLDLSLGAGGLISGTPEEPGTFDFTVTVTDADGLTASRTLTINVNP